MQHRTLFIALILAALLPAQGAFARGRHHHRRSSLAQHKGPKFRTRRVFRWLNSMPVSEHGFPYGFEQDDLAGFTELPSFHEEGSPIILTAENWDDFWVDWASARLAFPNQEPQTQLETVKALGFLRVPGTFQMVLDILENKLGFVELRKAAVETIKRWGGFASAHILAEQLKVEKDPEVKLALNQALSQIGGKPDAGRPSIETQPNGESYLQWQ